MSGTDDVAPSVVLAELARDLHAESECGVEAVAPRIARAATDVIEAVEFVGVTLMEGDEVRSTVRSDDVAEQFDRLQQEAGEGPGLDAVRVGRIVHAPDLTSDGRWPELAALVDEKSPVRSALSFELSTRRQGLGALTLTSTNVDGFSDADVERGYALAAHAALAVDAARRHEQFRNALASRDVIGQAKGVIMERFAVDDGRAFELLRELSQSTNISVAEISRRLTADVGQSADSAKS
ncbi:GAF and ANTAR domain-containing protein [Gordonia paraffinivorans]|uniref:GAF and ANTAR domain-containing protein n=1 Tax=Gordonia paraffinivorans TaxID=175628 RepID=UPI0014457550|nr:GAF and ANTAR domain-containing protein [Gordonia paraffinivorans]